MWAAGGGRWQVQVYLCLGRQAPKPHAAVSGEAAEALAIWPAGGEGEERRPSALEEGNLQS